MKKLYWCLFAILLLFMVMNPVLAVDAQGCKNVASIDIKITNAIHTVVVIIQIVVPILLVIFGSIDFVKAMISSKEDEIKKGQQTFIKRAIAGVLVFFIVAIVRLIISFAAGDESKDIFKCVNCFLNGTTSGGVCKK